MTNLTVYGLDQSTGQGRQLGGAFVATDSGGTQIGPSTTKTVMSGTLALASTSAYRQILDPNGANRIVTLPEPGGTSQALLLSNIGSSTFSIDVRDSVGSLFTLFANESREFSWDGVVWRGGFSPRDVPNVLIWLDAALDTYSDTTYATPQTADTGSVAGWKSQAGLGINFNQGTVGSRPIFKTSQVNGLPAVRFDGVNDFLTADSDVAFVSELSVFCAISRNWSTDNVSPLCGSPNLVAAVGWVFNPSSSYLASKRAMIYANGFNSINNNTGPLGWGAHNLSGSSWHVMGGVLGAFTDVRLDGTSIATSSRKGGTIGTCWPGLNVGTEAAAVYNQWFTGDLGELVIANGPITRPNVVRMERWLGRKFAITVA